jgi:hypothetical protein
MKTLGWVACSATLSFTWSEWRREERAESSLIRRLRSWSSADGWVVVEEEEGVGSRPSFIQS